MKITFDGCMAIKNKYVTEAEFDIRVKVAEMVHPGKT